MSHARILRGIGSIRGGQEKEQIFLTETAIKQSCTAMAYIYISAGYKTLVFNVSYSTDVNTFPNINNI